MPDCRPVCFRRLFTFLLLSVVVLVCAAPAAASPDSDQATSAPDLAPTRQSVTRHELRVNGATLDYTATAAEHLVSFDETSGLPDARIFSVAYTLDGADPKMRPVTFAFNGGPGAASVWLHLGALGPRRVVLGEDTSSRTALADNPDTWLAFTDLVFIDPVGTGLSRAVEETGKRNSEAGPGSGETGKRDASSGKSAGKARAFWSVERDTASVGEFIRQWLTREGRWLSPVYLCGESYGTTRAAALVPQLHQRYGISLSGVVLISPVLDFGTIFPSRTNIMPHVLILPSMAAIRAFHRAEGELSRPELERVLEEAESFALGEYLRALALGEALGAVERKRTLERLAALTGLPTGLLDKLELRVGVSRFTKELLSGQGRIIGRMDGTVTATDPEPAAIDPSFDPSLDRLFSPFSAAMHAYLRDELEFVSEAFYEFLNLRVNRSWDWSTGTGQGYLQTSPELARAVALDPNLRIMAVCGVYDLATPLLAWKYTERHLGLARELRENVVTHIYPGGHMMYTSAGQRAALTDDAAGFYAASRWK